jgi:hypothetical protein
MDPQATWDRLLCAYSEADWDTVEELATALLAWLERGGFPPKVLPTPAQLGPDFQSAIASAGCRHALKTNPQRGGSV